MAPLKINKQKATKRRVCFASEQTYKITLIPSLRDISEDEKRERYWQDSEFQSSKSATRRCVQDVLTHNRKGVDLIDSMYSYAVCLSDSLDDEQFDQLMSEPTELARALQPWQSRAVGRGLEKYVSEIHREDRYEVVEESRSAVLSLAHISGIDDEDVAQSYREQARSATLYARLVGVADAMEVKAESAPLRSSLSLLVSPRRKQFQGTQSPRRTLSRQLGQCFDDPKPTSCTYLDTTSRQECLPSFIARSDTQCQYVRHFEAPSIMPKRLSV